MVSQMALGASLMVSQMALGASLLVSQMALGASLMVSQMVLEAWYCQGSWSLVSVIHQRVICVLFYFDLLRLFDNQGGYSYLIYYSIYIKYSGLRCVHILLRSEGIPTSELS